MTFRDIAEKRCSIRGYENTPVSDKLLTTLLDAVRLAPSACNIQPITLIVVRDSTVHAALNAAYKREWFTNAPVIIVAGYDTTVSWKRSDGQEFGMVDVAIAVDHLTLAAVEYGLGTCWIGAFDQKKVRDAVHVPEHIEIVAMVPLGYPCKEPSEKKRKEINEFVHYDFYGNKGLSTANG